MWGCRTIIPLLIIGVGPLTTCGGDDEDKGISNCWKCLDDYCECIDDEVDIEASLECANTAAKCVAAKCTEAEAVDVDLESCGAANGEDTGGDADNRDNGGNSENLSSDCVTLTINGRWWSPSINSTRPRKAGDQYLLVEVTVANCEEGDPAGLNEDFFQIETEALVYVASGTTYHLEDRCYQDILVPAGGEHSCSLAFEIPRDQEPVVLYYENEDGVTAQIDFPPSTSPFFCEGGREAIFLPEYDEDRCKSCFESYCENDEREALCEEDEACLYCRVSGVEEDPSSYCSCFEESGPCDNGCFDAMTDFGDCVLEHCMVECV